MTTKSDYVESRQQPERRRGIMQHIPASIFVGLVIQTFVWVWLAATFTSTTNARLAQAEKRLDMAEDIPARIARMEARIDVTNSLLAENNRILQQVQANR